MEVLIHLVETSEHLAEVLGTNGDHQRKANCRVKRGATANPVPEAKHVGRSYTKFGYFLSIRRDGDKVFGNSLLITQCLVTPCSSLACIGPRFIGCEGT